MKEITFTQKEIDQIKSDANIAMHAHISYLHNSVRIKDDEKIIVESKIKSYQSILDKLS